MTAKTHIMGGILAGELACAAFSMPTSYVPVLIAGAAAGALVPDIDHHGSKISRSSKTGRVVSSLVRSFATHRGGVHTPAFILLCASLMKSLGFLGVNEIAHVFSLGLLAGMLSHLLLDSFNPSGIMWLWPFTVRRISFANIRTNSLWEWVAAALLLASIVGFAMRFLPESLGAITALAGS